MQVIFMIMFAYILLCYGAMLCRRYTVYCGGHCCLIMNTKKTLAIRSIQSWWLRSLEYQNGTGEDELIAIRVVFF